VGESLIFEPEPPPAEEPANPSVGAVAGASGAAVEAGAGAASTEAIDSHAARLTESSVVAGASEAVVGWAARCAGLETPRVAGMVGATGRAVAEDDAESSAVSAVPRDVGTGVTALAVIWVEGFARVAVGSV
jgi:hypothetical protein